MPDTFDPHYSWLKTWRDNPCPPILFYGTSSNLVHEIEENGLTHRLEGENNPMAVAHHILSSAKKLGDKMIAEQAELILLEHGEKQSAPVGAHCNVPLRLTFNYHHALYLARKKTRRLEALQWLCETFRKRIGQSEYPELAELTVNRVIYSCGGVCDLYLNLSGVVVYVCTDLSKFQNLPPLLIDEKEIKRASKGKGSIAGNHWPKTSWWKKLKGVELERRLERLVRGDKDHPGLGKEVVTLQSIPTSDIVRIELPPLDASLK
jgi:hypothetical protein